MGKKLPPYPASITTPSGDWKEESLSKYQPVDE